MKMEWCYVGIDPGMRGGMVAIHDVPDQPPLYFSFDGGNRGSALSWLREIEDSAKSLYAVLEEIPYSIFGIKKSDMSKLYGSFAELRMAMMALGIPWSEVPAKTWLREFLSPRKKGESDAHWKNRHRDTARILFDDATITKDMSDAYLLSVYAKRLRLNQLSDAGERPEGRDGKAD